MNDQNKSKKQLIAELNQTRQKFSALEQAENKRKQTEEALKESEKLLRQVIDTSPYSLFVKDREGRYILVNKKFADSHKTTPESIVGLTDISVAGKWLTTKAEIEKFRASEREVTDAKKEILQFNVGDSSSNVGDSLMIRET